MDINPLSAKLTKWPNTLKQFVGNLLTNCLSVFGHFVGLGLFVWTLGSVIRVIRLIWTLKKTFVLYLSVTWIMVTHWIHGNSRILTITRITWITLFLFIPCLDQFCLYFPKSSVNGIPHKYKWQKSKTYVRNQTYKRLVWMAALIGYSVAWSVASPKFICLCINFSHYLD